MAKTTCIWTAQKTDEPADATSGNAAGHNLLVAVTEVSLIDSNVFVMQRAPVTPGSTDYEDCFYSLASVNDMADLAPGSPAVGSVFYRTNSINLLFGNLAALETALNDIKDGIGMLCAANDIALRLEDPVIQCFPADSHERYWGMSINQAVTDGDLLAFSHEPGLTRPFTHVFDTDGPKYIFVAYRASLGAGTGRPHEC